MRQHPGCGPLLLGAQRDLLLLDGRIPVWHLGEEVFEEEKVLREATLVEGLEMWEEA